MHVTNEYRWSALLSGFGIPNSSKQFQVRLLDVGKIHLYLIKCEAVPWGIPTELVEMPVEFSLGKFGTMTRKHLVDGITKRFK